MNRKQLEETCKEMKMKMKIIAKGMKKGKRNKGIKTKLNENDSKKTTTMKSKVAYEQKKRNGKEM